MQSSTTPKKGTTRVKKGQPTKSSKKKVSTGKTKAIRKSKADLTFFSNVSLLHDLSPSQIKKVFDIATKRKIDSGTDIMREGETGDTMYLFYEGQVEVLNTLTMKFGRGDFEETEKSLVKLNAKVVSFFGEMSMLEDAPRSATITASTDCVVYEITKKDFHDLCEKEPEVGYRILLRMSEVLCSRIRKSNRDILKLTTALSIALSR